MPYNDPKKQREYQRQWSRARRQTYLIGKFCVWCGSTEELEFHHIEPGKKIIWSWSFKRIDEEISKCIILCDSCHNGHHADERRLSHGTAAMYNHGGCRCEKCTKANTDYRRYLAHQPSKPGTRVYNL